MTRARPAPTVALLACVAASTVAAAATVHPAGAPYRYEVPSGFVQAPYRGASTNIGTSRFNSAVAPVAARPEARQTQDGIIVNAYTLTRDSDTIADATLAAVVRDLLKGKATVTSKVRLQRVAGSRAFTFTIAPPPGANWRGARLVFVFNGRREVFVNCQWKDLRRQITAGCASVTRSMRLV